MTLQILAITIESENDQKMNIIKNDLRNELQHIYQKDSSCRNSIWFY